MKRNLICSGIAALFLARCATVSHGPMQRIHVASEPARASVELSRCGAGSSRSAKTPATILVNRMATLCTLTFTLPEYGSRTVPLIRRWSPAIEENLELVDDLCGDDCNSPSEVAGALLVGATISAMAFGVDRMTGAMYEQNRSAIVVNFNDPIPNVAGRYSLMGVNGMELPAATWTDGSCEISTSSGWLVLEEGGRWSSSITEQRLCGKKKRPPRESVNEGVFTIDGERILLESDSGIDTAVLQDDRLDVTIRRFGLRDDQTAVYTLRLGARAAE